MNNRLEANKKEEEMAQTLSQAVTELKLAKENLEILIQKNWDTEEDHDLVRWLQIEVDRLSKADDRA